jgi:hypothetical protein
MSLFQNVHGNSTVFFLANFLQENNMLLKKTPILPFFSEKIAKNEKQI